MPDVDPQTAPEPPVGDPRSAQKYIDELISLINQEKISVYQTDIQKFDPSSLQNHFLIELKDYKIEISHNKQTESGKDYYVILFSNLKRIEDGSADRAILAYMYLTEEQFRAFRSAAEGQIEKKKKQAEEKRLQQALEPVDAAFNELKSSL